MKKMMTKYDLQKIQKNFFEAGVENTKIGNDLLFGLKNQIFQAVNLYLIFTATLFFFLQTKLHLIILNTSIGVWIVISIITSSLSLVFGLVALKIEHYHINNVRKGYLSKSQKMNDFIKETGVGAIDTGSIPKELEDIINHENIATGSSKCGNFFTILQAVLFGISLVVNIISVIGSIIY